MEGKGPNKDIESAMSVLRLSWERGDKVSENIGAEARGAMRDGIKKAGLGKVTESD